MRRRNKVFEGGMYDYGYSPYGVMVPMLAHDGAVSCVRLRLEGGLMLIHSPVGKPRGPKNGSSSGTRQKELQMSERQNAPFSVFSSYLYTYLPGSGSSFTPPTLLGEGAECCREGVE
eukprot:scaffold2908_cov80-Skeletonema_marinoi.AAC.1